MRFNKLFSAAAAVGVAGALALGGAATAHAATTNASNRVQLNLILEATSKEYAAVNSGSVGAAVTTTVGKTEASVSPNATRVTAPAGTTSGPVIDTTTGLCMTGHGQGVAMTWETCSLGTPMQLFTPTEHDSPGRVAGWALNLSGTDRWVQTDIDHAVTFGDDGVANVMNNFETSPTAGDIADITSPTAGSTVTTARPTLTGTGQPGATITATTQAGKNIGTATVAADGTWTITAKTDITAKNPIVTATQNDNGQLSTQSVAFTIKADPTQTLTAEVGSVDSSTMSASFSGTGKAGDTITITGTSGNQTVTVGADGTWTATVTGLASGDNVITVSDGTDTITVTATILPSPIVDPIVAAGAAGIALLAIGSTVFIRRRFNA